MKTNAQRQASYRQRIHNDAMAWRKLMNKNALRQDWEYVVYNVERHIRIERIAKDCSKGDFLASLANWNREGRNRWLYYPVHRMETYLPIQTMDKPKSSLLS